MPIEHGLPATLNEIPSARLSKEQSSRLPRCHMRARYDIRFANEQEEERSVSPVKTMKERSVLHLFTHLCAQFMRGEGLDMTIGHAMSKACGSAPREPPLLSGRLAACQTGARRCEWEWHHLHVKYE